MPLKKRLKYKKKKEQKNPPTAVKKSKWVLNLL